jgi:putative glutamine amidotransferase
VKIVAVSQRVDVYPERNERRDALDQRLCQWLVAAGFLPVPVPNGLGMDGLLKWLSAVRPAAIVLSGGNDIGGAIERDNTERQLLAYAQENTLPLLGVCRGMQMMGVWAGVTLKPVQGHTRTRHGLRGELVGEVNSFHNYSLDTCPAGFAVSAMAEDGCIEAIRHESLAWEGWMWHPEREADFQTCDIQRLKVLFDE